MLSCIYWLCIKTFRNHSEKKTLRHPQAKESLRSEFIEALDQLKQKHPIVYLDESGFKSHDYRPYGYSLKGTPCYGSFNWQLKNQTNAIGALYQGQLFAVGLFDCKINSNVFHFWVEQFLIPELPQNSVIVMDNAAFHKRSDIRIYRSYWNTMGIRFYGCLLIVLI
ncbi:transposase [Acinetobacter sp. B10A]|nr:transposase [Acinetobacter baretiae]